MQIESLQRSLDESKTDQQVNHIQNSDQQVNQELQNRIDHLQNALAQEREKHRHQMQEALSTVGQEKSSLQIEIDNLKDTLSQSQAHSEQTKQALQNALFDAKEKHKKELLETFCKLEQEKQSLHLETEQLRATVSKLTVNCQTFHNRERKRRPFKPTKVTPTKGNRRSWKDNIRR